MSALLENPNFGGNHPWSQTKDHEELMVQEGLFEHFRTIKINGYGSLTSILGSDFQTENAPTLLVLLKEKSAEAIPLMREVINAIERSKDIVLRDYHAETGVWVLNKEDLIGIHKDTFEGLDEEGRKCVLLYDQIAGRDARIFLGEVFDYLDTQFPNGKPLDVYGEKVLSNRTNWHFSVEDTKTGRYVNFQPNADASKIPENLVDRISSIPSEDARARGASTIESVEGLLEHVIGDKKLISVIYRRTWLFKIID